MARLLYDVLYTTDQSKDQVERLLQARCTGAWQVEAEPEAEVEPESLDGELEDAHRFRVVFERETDIRSLCRP